MFIALLPAFRPLLRRLFGRSARPPAGPGPSPSAPQAPAPSDQPEAPVSVEAIEHLTGRPVRDLPLYTRALTHRSVLRGQPDSHLASNERLEFLGDSVLGFVTAEHLYDRFPEENEGFLTRMRAKLVNGQALAQAARRIDLGPHVLLSDNMEQSGGRDNATILADAFEALIGALYLDHDLEAARHFIHRAMLHEIDLGDLAERNENFKSLLLEFAQGQGWPQPQYRIAAEEGPSHDKTFTVEVLLKNHPYGLGRAGSKKQAEQRAAAEALERLRQQERAAS